MTQVPSKLFEVVANAVALELFKDRADTPAGMDQVLVELNDAEREQVQRISLRVIANVAEFLGTTDPESPTETS